MMKETPKGSDYDDLAKTVYAAHLFENAKGLERRPRHPNIGYPLEVQNSDNAKAIFIVECVERPYDLFQDSCVVFTAVVKSGRVDEHRLASIIAKILEQLYICRACIPIRKI
jgi:hypothetical protein